MPQGLFARISGEGPGAGRLRIFVNPTSSSHAPISSNDQVLPSWVFTSMLTAKKRLGTGPVRSGGRPSGLDYSRRSCRKSGATGFSYSE